MSRLVFSKPYTVINNPNTVPLEGKQNGTVSVLRGGGAVLEVLLYLYIMYSCIIYFISGILGDKKTSQLSCRGACHHPPATLNYNRSVTWFL